MRIACLSMALGLMAAAASAQPCDRSPLLVHDVAVWTPRGSTDGRDVVFRDGRIASISPSKGQRPSGIRAIDGSGHTLLPGLIDVHLHFVVPGGLPGGDASARRAIDITGRQTLRSGVTSGRLHLESIATASELKRLSADDCHPLPRLQVGGPGIGGAAERDGSVFWGARTAADAREKVARIGAAGLDWLAVHDADRFPADVLDALVTSARRLGLRLLGAGTRPEEIDAVLRVNPDTLDYFDRSDQPAYPPELLQRMRERRPVLVPIVGIYRRIGTYLAQPQLVEAPANFEFFHPDEQRFALAAARKHLAGDPLVARVRRVQPALARKAQQLRELGVPVAFGSDAGSQLHFHAGAIWWELEAWRTFGASHRDSLIAATEGGAGVLRSTDAGRLEVGARADFVLYRGKVEDGPFEALRVLAVGKGGVLHVAGGKWIGR